MDLASAANASIVPAANGLTQEMKDRGIKLNKNVGLSVDYMGFNIQNAGEAVKESPDITTHSGRKGPYGYKDWWPVSLTRSNTPWT